MLKLPFAGEWEFILDKTAGGGVICQSIYGKSMQNKFLKIFAIGVIMLSQSYSIANAQDTIKNANVTGDWSFKVIPRIEASSNHGVISDNTFFGDLGIKSKNIGATADFKGVIGNGFGEFKAVLLNLNLKLSSYIGNNELFVLGGKKTLTDGGSSMVHGNVSTQMYVNGVGAGVTSGYSNLIAAGVKGKKFETFLGATSAGKDGSVFDYSNFKGGKAIAFASSNPVKYLFLQLLLEYSWQAKDLTKAQLGAFFDNGILAAGADVIYDNSGQKSLCLIPTSKVRLNENLAVYMQMLFRMMQKQGPGGAFYQIVGLQMRGMYFGVGLEKVGTERPNVIVEAGYAIIISKKGNGLPMLAKGKIIE